MKAQFEFLLKQYSISQLELSEKLSVSKSTISHIMAGRNKPSMEIILGVMQEFKEINIEWFLTGNGQKLKSQENEAPKVDYKKVINEEISRLEYSIGMIQRELQHQLAQLKDKIADL